MATWPTTLPTVPLVAGFQETAPDMAIRTNVEYGPAKMRRRFTGVIRQFSWPLVLTLTQTATLDAFYVATCEGGVLTFTLPHPRTGDAMTCRFLAPPAYESLGAGYFRTVLQLEALP